MCQTWQDSTSGYSWTSRRAGLANDRKFVREHPVGGEDRCPACRRRPCTLRDADFPADPSQRSGTRCPVDIACVSASDASCRCARVRCWRRHRNNHGEDAACGPSGSFSRPRHHAGQYCRGSRTTGRCGLPVGQGARWRTRDGLALARRLWHDGDMTGAVDVLSGAAGRAGRLRRAPTFSASCVVFRGAAPKLAAVGGYKPVAKTVLHILTNSLPHTESGCDAQRVAFDTQSAA